MVEEKAWKESLTMHMVPSTVPSYSISLDQDQYQHKNWNREWRNQTTNYQFVNH